MENKNVSAIGLLVALARLGSAETLDAALTGSHALVAASSMEDRLRIVNAWNKSPRKNKPLPGE